MSYIKAEHILPAEVIALVQTYIDGECIYIPRKLSNKKKWGSKTTTREELGFRDRQIYQDYLSGHRSECLAEKYFLSLKSIQRIVRQEKMKRT